MDLSKKTQSDIYAETFKAYGLPAPTPEYKFDLVRKWRIDYAWPAIKLAVELEGGAYTRGRHTRGYGFIGDMEKYNALAEQGWTLLRYVPDVRKIKYTQIFSVYRKLFNTK
jgi:very-short-patch-repair endonuclease